jgi:hypothetical protein
VRERVAAYVKYDAANPQYGFRRVSIHELLTPIITSGHQLVQTARTDEQPQAFGKKGLIRFVR